MPLHAKRIPIAVWSGLRFDLSPYLADRGAPGGTVSNVYHRQVGNFSRQRFVGNSITRYWRHRRLAHYFTRLDWRLKPSSEASANQSSLLFGRPNVRKVTELREQLLAIAREAEAADNRAKTEMAFPGRSRANSGCFNAHADTASFSADNASNICTGGTCHLSITVCAIWSETMQTLST
ncbi:MAG: hypothetical protein K8T89_07155 [Planctomycetes bacterium]|nr:hypothetical protein [Planctomycetota bacterium]